MLKCPKCSYPNKDAYTVCNMCGEPLTGVASAAAPPPPAAPAPVRGPAARGAVVSGSTWSDARFGISLSCPKDPGWKLVTDAKDFRRKDALVEIAHPADTYVLSLVPYDWKLVQPGTALSDFARRPLDEERKNGRLVLGRKTLALDGRAAVQVQESYLDAATGKSTQEINVLVERAAGFLRLVVSQAGREFEAHLPQFNAIVGSLKLDPTGDIPTAWTHPSLRITLARPAGAEGAAWVWLLDPEALEARGGGWIAELVNAAAQARVAVRAIDPAAFSPAPGTFAEAVACLAAAWAGAAPDFAFVSPPARRDAAGAGLLAVDVTYTDPQRGPLRARRYVSPHPSKSLVEVVAEAPSAQFESVVAGFEAILDTLRLPEGTPPLPLAAPHAVAPWGLTIGAAPDLRWALCTTPALLEGEGCVAEFRDLADPTARIDLRIHKRLSSKDLGTTLGDWALRLERGTKEEVDFNFEDKKPTQLDGQLALSLQRSWKLPGGGGARRDRLVCFERKGAVGVFRALARPDDFARVDAALSKILEGTKLAATHHVASILESGATMRVIKPRRGVGGDPPSPSSGFGGQAPSSPPSGPGGPVPAATAAAPPPPAPVAPPPAPPTPPAPVPPPAEAAPAPDAGRKTMRTRRSKAAATPVAPAVALTVETPVEALEAALQADPGNARAAILLALRRIEAQQVDDAARLLREAADRMRP